MSNLPSPIDDLLGSELAYIKRGLSQLELILACKDTRISELDQQLILANFETLSLKKQVTDLQCEINELQLKLAKIEKVTISDLEAQDTFDKFFNEFQ